MTKKEHDNKPQVIVARYCPWPSCKRAADDRDSAGRLLWCCREHWSQIPEELQKELVLAMPVVPPVLLAKVQAWINLNYRGL